MGPETGNAKNRGFGVWGENRKNKAGMSQGYTYQGRYVPNIFLGS